MSEVMVSWIDDDGTRCVLCGDARGFELRIVRTDGQTTHVEPVDDLLYAIKVRASELQRMMQMHSPA